MRIVASGARRDLGQLDAAVVTLQCAELESTSTESWSARLKFAYADALLAAGREDDAREWFAKAVSADVNDETDAAERLADLDGIVWVDTLDGDEDSDLDADESDEPTDEVDADESDADDDGDESDADESDADDEYDDDLVAELAVVAELTASDDEHDEDDDNLGEFAPPALEVDRRDEHDDEASEGSAPVVDVAAVEFSDDDVEATRGGDADAAPIESRPDTD
jgi:hypothetical protein